MVKIKDPNQQIVKLKAEIDALYENNNKENTNVASGDKLYNLIRKLRNDYGIEYNPASSENKRTTNQKNPAKKSAEKSAEKSSEKYSEKSSEKSTEKKKTTKKKKPDENKKNYSATRENEEAIEDVEKLQDLLKKMEAARDDAEYSDFFHQILETVDDIKIDKNYSSKLIGKIKKLKQLVENLDKLYELRNNDSNKKMTEEKRQKLNKNYKNTLQQILSTIENLDQNKKKTKKAKTTTQANNNPANINDDLFIETRNIMQGLEKVIRSAENQEYIDNRNELLHLINQLKTDKAIYSQKLNNKIVTIKKLVKKIISIFRLPANEETQNSYYKLISELLDKIKNWDESGGYCARGTRWHKKTEKCLTFPQGWEEYEDEHPKRERCPDGERRFQGKCRDYNDKKSKAKIRPLDEFRKVRHFLPENAYLPEKAIHPNYKFRADDYAERLKNLHFITPKKRYHKTTRKLRDLGPNEENQVKKFLKKNKKLAEHAEKDIRGRDFRRTNRRRFDQVPISPVNRRIQNNHRFKYDNNDDDDGDDSDDTDDDSDDTDDGSDDDDDSDDENIDFDKIGNNRDFGISDDDTNDLYDRFKNTEYGSDTGNKNDDDNIPQSFIEPPNSKQKSYDPENDLDLFGDALDNPVNEEEFSNTSYLQAQKKRSGGNTQKKSRIGKTKKRTQRRKTRKSYKRKTTSKK